jgi:hypothetical protein
MLVHTYYLAHLTNINNRNTDLGHFESCLPPSMWPARQASSPISPQSCNNPSASVLLVDLQRHTWQKNDSRATTNPRLGTRARENGNIVPSPCPPGASLCRIRHEVVGRSCRTDWDLEWLYRTNRVGKTGALCDAFCVEKKEHLKWVCREEWGEVICACVGAGAVLWEYCLRTR